MFIVSVTIKDTHFRELPQSVFTSLQQRSASPSDYSSLGALQAPRSCITFLRLIKTSNAAIRGTPALEI